MSFLAVSNIAFCFSVATNGTPSGISSHDIQPSVPVPTYQPPAQTFSGIIYDRGLMEAVTNAQNFVAQTFPGARLLESHNVSFPFVCKTSSHQNLVTKKKKLSHQNNGRVSNQSYCSADDIDRRSKRFGPNVVLCKNKIHVIDGQNTCDKIKRQRALSKSQELAGWTMTGPVILTMK